MIRIGTSSWTDPEFVRDWYPPKLPAAARLGWYAEHFDYVEVNSTFYAIPARKVVQRWDSETPDDFLFDIKLHGLLSRHAVKIVSLPPDLRHFARSNPSGNLIVTPELERVVIARILQEIEPLSEAGNWACFCCSSVRRFPRASTSSMNLIIWFPFSVIGVWPLNFAIATGLPMLIGMPLCSSLEAKALALVLVDAPQSEHFTVMQTENQVTDPRLTYLRLHGRNARAYISGRSVAERFNYDYSDQEIDEVADRVRELAEDTEDVHVAFNNNHSLYAPKAALRLKPFWGLLQRERPQPGSRP